MYRDLHVNLTSTRRRNHEGKWLAINRSVFYLDFLVFQFNNILDEPLSTTEKLILRLIFNTLKVF